MNNQFLIIILIAVLFLLAAGIILIFLGIKIYRSTNKKSIFIGNQDINKMSEDMQKLFDNFPNIPNQQSQNSQNTQTSYAYKPTSYDKTHSIPAHPLDKQPGLNYNTKALIFALVWIMGFIAILTAVMGFTNDTIAPILGNVGFSKTAIVIVFFVIFMILFSLATGLLFLVRNKMNKNLPQYFTQGTVVVRKIVGRKKYTGRGRYIVRNFCVTTIAIGDVCIDFDTPVAIYNAIHENDFVNIFYNKFSEHSFLITNFTR